MSVTPRQYAIMRYVAEHRRQHGYAPTLDEIARQLGITKPTVHEHVRALERKDLVERRTYRSRSIELTGLGRKVLDGDEVQQLRRRVAELEGEVARLRRGELAAV